MQKKDSKVSEADSIREFIYLNGVASDGVVFSLVVFDCGVVSDSAGVEFEAEGEELDDFGVACVGNEAEVGNVPGGGLMSLGVDGFLTPMSKL